ncbi:hypothetical protein NLJ89_g7395 [Agrocybe chaxingu]|uniref:Fumarate reductase n=1 Tax=Agrocybe chaxingu TaxID=84603 RepID=A0A9W8JZ82_9AGAR|nr:hypothetical protein NLJ89_g7395 [Agrocybe chaxingu]
MRPGKQTLLTVVLPSVVLIPAIALILNRLMSATTAPSSTRSVIVVGSGLAGLSAASQLVAHNVPVHLLERAPKPGGNSIKASSGINGAPTRFQTTPDSLFYEDTVQSAGNAFKGSEIRECREKLISTLTNTSESAVSWLNDEKGVDLSRVGLLGGHSLPRTHRGAGKLPPGAAIVTTLLKSLQQSPLFHLHTGSSVTKVLKSAKSVEGVEYSEGDETKMLRGPVVFASGGFAGDSKGMLAEYRPDLTGFPSTNEAIPGSQSLLTAVGAQLLDMERVQVHPTGFVDSKNVEAPVKFLAAEILRGEGGLLLLNGKRFVNEMETRQHITDVILTTPPVDTTPRQWDIQLVLDEGAYNALSSHVDFYIFKGLMRKAAIAELDLSDAALPSIQEYAKAAAGLVSDPFSRKTFGSWTLKEIKPESIVYVGRVTPVVHFTMGGVLISQDAEVLDVDGKPIEGLWAAGEVTGGLHGDNRLGGSSLLECAVFGRIAGNRAAAFARSSD